MSILVPQNFYKETVAVAWTTGGGNFYVSTKPTVSAGYLVLSASNSSLREIVKFTAVGTDGTGDYVTVLAADRGLGGTTEQTHAVGESVYMNITAQTIQELSDAIDQIVAAGAQDSSTTTKGIVKLSTAPTSPTEPIAVGTNDFTLLPTTAQKAALAGDGGTPSGTNTFKLKSRTLTAGATISGATTPVPVYQNKTDNEFYACDANDTSAMKFLGFAISDGTDGNDIEVQFSGVVSGFTGLSEGEKYYVQDAVGTIGTSPGTYEILVGVAISETELLIQKGKRRAVGSTSIGTASGTDVIVCGFRPNVVRLKGGASNSSEGSIMEAIWNNGTLVGFGILYDGSVGTSSNSPVIYHDQSGNSMTFSITSVTDTGFTISWTETGSFGPTSSYLKWEAEGEL